MLLNAPFPGMHHDRPRPDRYAFLLIYWIGLCKLIVTQKQKKGSEANGFY